MAGSNRLSVAVLSLTILAGVLCLQGLGFTPNGVMQNLISILNARSPKWPGSKHPLKTSHTGIKPLDALVTNLNPFFAPIVDGTDPSLSLWTLFMVGQYGIGVALTWLEGTRGVNSGRVISYVTLFTQINQIVGFAIIFPTYTLLYTLFSPLAQPQPQSSTSSSATTTTIASSLPPLSTLRSLPYALSIGYLLPTILLPFSRFFSDLDTHQTLWSIWQLFPLWISLIHFILSKTIFSSSSSTPSPSTTSLPPTYTNHLKQTHTFLLLLGSATHLPTLLVTLYPSLLTPFFPRLSRSIIAHNTTISSVYTPYLPSPSWRAKDLADGVHVFLWWDVYISSVAGFTWALTLLKEAVSTSTNNTTSPQRAGGKKGKEKKGGVSWGKVGFWTLVAGPFGGIATLLRERDLAILRRGGQKID